MTQQYVDTQKTLGKKSVKQLQKQAKRGVSQNKNNALASKYSQNDFKGVSNQDYGQLLKLAGQAQGAGLGQHQIAYVRVPAVKLALPIYQGTNQYTLSLGATTYFANQKMGEGNYVLAGHNMNMPGVLFSNVPQIPMGSKIELIKQNAVYYYRVDKTTTVSPNQPYVGNTPSRSSVLYQKPSRPEVTLFTCNSTGAVREVVQGTLTSATIN